MLKSNKAVIFISIVLLLFSEKAMTADSLSKIDASKYLRNSGFNDSFLDTYFRSSPGSLPVNSMFIESELLLRRDAMMNYIPISRTKLTRRLDFMFEDVPMYSIFSSSNDLSRFYVLANFFYLESNNNDSSEIILISDNYNFKADTSLRKNTANLNLGAGNQIGSLSGHYFTESNFLKYFIAASYVNSIGIPLSNQTPSDIIAPAKILKRSNTENGTIYGKMFFDNGTSEVGFSFLIGRGDKTIPYSARIAARKFYRFTGLDDNLINFNFKTIIDNFVSVRGNIFYKQSQSTFHSYDDSTYTTKLEANSFESFEDGYNYGGRISARFDWLNLSPTTVSFDYIRNVMNRSENVGFPVNRYEVESIALSARQVYTYDNFKLFGTGRYSIIKPLFSNYLNPSNSMGEIDLSMNVKYYFNKNLSLCYILSKENRLPSMQEIFYQGRFEQTESKALKSEREVHSKFGLLNHNTEYELFTYLYYSEINDIITSESNINRELKFYNNGYARSFGIHSGFKVFSDYGYILLNYTFTDYLVQPSFLSKPKHIAEIKIYNTYQFGLRWQFEAEYYSNNYFMKENRNNIMVENLFLLNLKIGAKLLTNNEIFIGGYNLLDTYYESEYGLPGAGFNFFVGISINL